MSTMGRVLFYIGLNCLGLFALRAHAHSKPIQTLRLCLYTFDSKSTSETKDNQLIY